MNLGFRWDTKKAGGNLKKHGVSFDEATGAFYDENALILTDPLHSIGEERFLVVAHLYLEDIEVVRIISARLATKREQEQYHYHGG